MKIIGQYTGQAENDAIVCLDHPLEEGGQFFTEQFFPEGFMCDFCGNVIKA